MSSTRNTPLSTESIRRIQADPNYIELERARNSLGWILAISMMVIYFIFILLVAFDKSFLSIQVYGVITLAFPVGLFVILSAIGITGFYVRRANRQFDQLTRKVVEAAR